MRTEETWTHIHAERAKMAATLASLTPEQWGTQSWCDGWTVKVLAGHILAAAEQTPLSFYRKMISAGFRFNVFADADARRLAVLSPDEMVRRLEARTTTTNHPPAPVMAMLGEIVVHGQDLRRPLGLHHASPAPALVAVADNYLKTNLLIGSKRRSSGLALRATDVDWSAGEGPDVTGPLISLILALAGRKGAVGDLTGQGVSVLSGRM